MSHLPLNALPYEGRLADSLNRRIKTHISEREKFDAGTFKASPFPNPRISPEMELVGREIFLRKRIIEALGIAGADPAEHSAALATLHTRYKDLERQHLMRPKAVI